MTTPKDYSETSIRDLADILNHIDRDKYPENVAAVDAEIRRRSSESFEDLIRARAILESEAWPELDGVLAQWIGEAREREGITDGFVPPSLRYRTGIARLIAVIIDGVIIFAVNWAAKFVLVMLGMGSIAAVWDNIGGIDLLFVAYSVFLHGKYGKTLGKHIAGVRVVDVENEQKINFQTAAMRDIVPIVGLALGMGISILSVAAPSFVIPTAILYLLLPFLFAFFLWPLLELVTMLLNEKRRAIHDYIAGTVVVVD